MVENSRRSAATLLALLTLLGAGADLSRANPAETHARADAAAPSEGLVAHWPMEDIGAGRVSDLSANELVGVLHGDASAADGVRGRSLKLDGQFAYATVEDKDVLDFADATFSVTAWVNAYALRGNQQMIVGKNVYTANQREWGLMVDRDRRFRFYLRCDGQWKTVESTTMPKPGRWYHVALTVDAGRARMYVGGKLQGAGDLGRPIANTSAPLTLGGINDGGRLRQMFFGALDEVRLYDRPLSEEEIQAMVVLVTATHAVPDDPRYLLWDPDKPVPTAAECLTLEGVEFTVAKARQPDVDGYNWLHGAAVGWHNEELYVSFGHNKGSENTATEVARGRISRDGGKTWGDVFTIDDGNEPNLAISHGVFLSHAGCLWAFHGSFYGRMQNVHDRAYLLDKSSGTWQAKGVVARGGFWPCQEPLKMDDGNWILAGISVGNGYGGSDDPAAVAISLGEDFTRWDVVVIPKPKDLDMWGESTVIVDGPEILNIARWGKPVALAAVSRDYGRTWTESRPSNLPMAGSKPYAGLLSTGQRYLICTTTTDSGNRRSPLTIAVGRPGEKVFSRVYRIRDAVHKGPGESGPNHRLSYPYAVEHEGKLYVVYSNDGGRGGNRNSAEMAIIPIQSLQAE